MTQFPHTLTQFPHTLAQFTRCSHAMTHFDIVHAHFGTVHTLMLFAHLKLSLAFRIGLWMKVLPPPSVDESVAASIG